LSSQIIQCAANFSEGRDTWICEAIVDSARRSSDAVIADYSWDTDHNRMVLSLLGGPEAIRKGIFGAAKRAVALIDLRVHRGAHPRLGAVDVIPLVPIREITMDECIDLSRLVGGDIADGLGVPVFFYERSAAATHRTSLAEIRRGGYEALAAQELVGECAPDLGPSRVHPSAGAVVIGARGPLVAYNINLDTRDTGIAKAIARKIRSGEGGLIGVRSIGVWLAARRLAQVSMNVIRPDEAPLRAVFEFVESEARKLGVEVAESEIIGLVSRKYLEGASPELLKAKTFKPTQILEYWLDRVA